MRRMYQAYWDEFHSHDQECRLNKEFTTISKAGMASNPNEIQLWGSMFDDVNYYVRLCGIFGMTHDSSLIDIKPYDSRKQDSHKIKINGGTKKLPKLICQDHI
ncbi:hypothetical protein PsorP6_018242 [Peronosclerospora sorghi]|uniref:Uncharacterized protein n=1 Tax=Peronosclerospora sorghi TaxID=230839 RepID=A0ACC0WDG1_9STRA|nr:hypothetical protein PsorP6_018242 [Peronosclerospora sorghi]